MVSQNVKAITFNKDKALKLLWILCRSMSKLGNSTRKTRGSVTSDVKWSCFYCVCRCHKKFELARGAWPPPALPSTSVINGFAISVPPLKWHSYFHNRHFIWGHTTHPHTAATHWWRAGAKSSPVSSVKSSFPVHLEWKFNDISTLSTRVWAVSIFFKVY